MGINQEANITLNGDVSPLRRKLREASEALKKTGADGEAAFTRMTGPLGALQSKFVAIGALLAGGAVFRGAVAQTTLLTEESTKLGRALGISASEASILREALTAGNTSQEEFVGAAQKLAKQVKENESGLNAMGLKTRDAAGQLRPLNDLMFDAIAVVNGYKAGTDRAIAGQVLFGKGFEMTSNLALLNKKAVGEVAEQMRALGVVVGEESVRSWKEFDDAGDRAGITLKGLNVVVGEAVLPVLTALNEAFAAVGPYLVRFTRLIMETFLGVADLFQLVKQSFVSVGSDIGAVAAAAAKALKGDFSGAMDVFRARAEDAIKETQRLKDLWNGTGDSFLGQFRAKATQKDALVPDGGDQSADGLIKDKDKDKKTKKAAEDPGRMGTYEAALAERKNLYEQENVLRQFSKQQELAYWRDLQATHEINSKDQLAIAKRTATLELEIRREMGRQGVELTRIEIEGQRAAALEKIDALEGIAKFEQEQDQITKDQLLTQQQTFLAQRYEIELLAALQRQELARINGDDPVEMAKLQQQKLDMERSFQREMGEIQQQRTLESTKDYRNMYASMESGFASVLKNFMTGAQTIGQTITGLFRAVSDAVAGMLAELAARWLLQQLLQFVGIKTTAVGTIQAKAAEAGAGGVASMAAAPFPINLTAPGFGAAMAAIAASYSGVVASASRGYDIPKGLNPVTQLHEEEMVLPQKYANVIRGMVGAQGGEGGGDTYTTHITAMDARSVRDYFKANAHALGPALQRMARNGVNFSN